jgi:hypothetical protein
MDLRAWLRGLGLEEYEAAFRDKIDETVLPSLTAEDLKELGVTALGHRRKLLDAIALCVPTGAVIGPRLTQHPCQLPRASLRTARNAAK